VSGCALAADPLDWRGCCTTGNTDKTEDGQDARERERKRAEKGRKKSFYAGYDVAELASSPLHANPGAIPFCPSALYVIRFYLFFFFFYSTKIPTARKLIFGS
jgi:hypothetical protein